MKKAPDEAAAESRLYKFLEKGGRGNYQKMRCVRLSLFSLE
jgi:hypothetical protein